MSKNKHPGVARRKYALANVSQVNHGRHVKMVLNRVGDKMEVRDNLEPTTKRRSHESKQVRIDVTKAIVELEKRGQIKRIRMRQAGNCNITVFKEA